MKYIFEDRQRGAGGAIHRDMVGHMEVLCVLASMCKEIAEFGVRTGNSTVAFLHGLQQSGGGKLFSYDFNNHELDFEPAKKAPHVEWAFTRCDTRQLESIPSVDMLFIDTLHTYDQIKAELRYARHVKKWIVMHDTEFNRLQGEECKLGIGPAITEFLNDNREVWRQLCHFRHANGLTILTRISSP